MLKRYGLWLVLLAGAVWYFLSKKSAPTGGAAAKFAVVPAAQLGGGNAKTFLQSQELAAGTTIDAPANPAAAARVKDMTATVADFLDLPPGYLAEVLLSYTQQQCGAPGAPDGPYVPESPFAQAAVNAMAQIVPEYNHQIDGCPAKVKFLTAFVKRTGRPKLWGINL